MKQENKNFCLKSEEFNKKRPKSNMAFKIFKNFNYAGNHTNAFIPSKIPDTCTDINIWKYEVIKNGKLITSKKPITTTTEYKKNNGMPFLISCSLFGSNEKYIDGLFDMLESLKLFELDKNWDVRVYIASKKNGKKVNLSVGKNLQNRMLKGGIELVHIDNNNPNGFSLEGTFWRFLALTEKARILIRDVDWVFTAQEVISIAEWIESKLVWHRLLNFQLINTPFLAGQFGAIGKPTLIKNLHEKVRHFSYKKKYGDDEFFTLTYLFIDALKQDSICTHYYDFKIKLVPFKESSFFPTNKYITEIIGKEIKKQKSIDIALPLEYGIQKLFLKTNNFTKMDSEKKEKYKEYFKLSNFGERGENAAKILKIEYF